MVSKSNLTNLLALSDHFLTKVCGVKDFFQLFFYSSFFSYLRNFIRTLGGGQYLRNIPVGSQSTVDGTSGPCHRSNLFSLSYSMILQ